MHQACHLQHILPTATRHISVKRRPRTQCFCVVSALPRVSQLYRDHTTQSRALASDTRHRDPYALQQHDGLANQASRLLSIQRLELADEYSSVQIQRPPQSRVSRYKNLQTQTSALTRQLKNLPPLRRHLQRPFRYSPMSCLCAVRDVARTRRQSHPLIRDITICLEGE